MLLKLTLEKPSIDKQARDFAFLKDNEERYARNEEEDLKDAIKFLYEFKRKLMTLHPNCIHLIDDMLHQ